MTDSNDGARPTDGSDIVRRRFLRSVAAAGGGGVLASSVAAAGEGATPTCRQDDSRTVRSGHVSEGGRWTDSHELGESVCDARIELAPTGDRDADLDLYVTLDGRRPSTDDYDHTSVSDDSGEEVVLASEETHASQTIGIAVESYSGAGSFEVVVVESREAEPRLVRPTVSTGRAGPVSDTAATLNGTLEDLGVTNEVDVYFEYRPTGSGIAWESTEAETVSSTGWFRHRVSGLDPVTEYEFRAVAVGIVLPVRGSTETFTTGDGSCFVTTATHWRGETLDSLRRFRDESMAATPLGRALAGLYYRISPPIARTLERHPGSRTASAVRRLVRACASLSDRQEVTASRVASAGLGVVLTALYAVGLLVAAAGHAGISALESLDRD